MARTGVVIVFCTIQLRVGHEKILSHRLDVEGRIPRGQAIVIESLFGDVHPVEPAVIHLYTRVMEIRNVQKMCPANLTPEDWRAADETNRRPAGAPGPRQMALLGALRFPSYQAS
jgi:hypothetical protein